MERTCNGCWALVRYYKYAGCEFQIKTRTCKVNPEIAPVPLEECPKPKSRQALIALRKIREDRKWG